MFMYSQRAFAMVVHVRPRMVPSADCRCTPVRPAQHSLVDLKIFYDMEPLKFRIPFMISMTTTLGSVNDKARIKQ